MKTRAAAFMLGLAVLGGGSPTALLPAATAAQPQKPTISAEAGAALLRMGESLRAGSFSFKARTIRVYSEADGQPLHIYHTTSVTVRRPDKLRVETSGDDGSNDLVFDGKTLTIFSPAAKKYASVPAPAAGTTIEAMLKDAIGRFGVDLPLADFLSEAPNKAFLTDVTTGRVVNTGSIDGEEYLHLFFLQPPGIELELWVEKGGRSLPRRLIVTYRQIQGEPNFIADFSDWNFDIHPADGDFAFQAPAGAVQVAMKPVAAMSGTAGGARK